MPALQVKDCPSDVYERLRACAAEENRSISQQALTIIEDFLDMRAAQAARPTRTARTASGPKPTRSRSYYTQADDGVDYAAKHARVFEEIHKLRPIPIDESRPSAVELLRQIRQEEAR